MKLYPITLATLHTFTKQQVFDHIVYHLLTQLKRSGRVESWGNFMCKYKVINLSCAAGCLIGDHEYNAEQFEYNNWLDLIKAQIVPDIHTVLICDLQEIHDKRKVDEWKDLLYQYSITNNLQFNFGV